MATSRKLEPFGTSIFTEMSRLALQHGAINLSQGFPDFDGPASIIEIAVEALRGGQNQYARSMGHPLLVEAIADDLDARHGLRWNPMSEVAVFAGCTEALMASMVGLLNPGDEVIFFEPFYDSYPVCAAVAGATARYCPLRFPDFAVDFDHLAALFNPLTRLIVINTPNNPTGKVFSAEELTRIAALCVEHDVIALTDEVYEHLTYEGARHTPMATIEGMRDRTLSLSSGGKTFSFTGWKVGWATGPAPLVAAAQAAHQFTTFCTPAPFQIATARAIRQGPEGYLDELRAAYAARRAFLIDALESVGLKVARPQGTYFVLADFADLWEGDDLSFARHLTAEIKVAAIPPSGFYHDHPEEGRRLVRFAFCKQMSTLEAAAERLQALRR